MVKLTPELIQQAMQYINPVKDRELDLRGYKIPIIENLGATLDQFDTIDLSDNDVRKLDGFPLLKRLKCILINNNRIMRIGENLGNCLPNLQNLIMSGNMIQELADIDPLATLPKLTTLSLMHCPVVTKQHYRLYVAFKLPSLRLLDFRKIKDKERLEANALFKSKKGRALQREIATKAKIVANSSQEKKFISGPAKTEISKIREAIANAKSLEEVERLNRLLQSGQFGVDKPRNGNADNEEEEEDEEMDGEGMEENSFMETESY